jgi:hypothetical protein
MEFVETSIFTRRIQELLTDEEYQRLQSVLAENPKAGESSLEEAASGKSGGGQEAMASEERSGSYTTVSRRIDCI